MRIGPLRDRLTIQTDRSSTVDEMGQPIPDWQTDGVRWGNVEPLSGREYWQAQQVQAETTYRVTLRWTALLTSGKQRFLWDGKVLEIEAVTNPDGKKRDMQAMCHLKESPSG